jgi:alpha-1,6-mannosyltransferase
MASLTLAGIVYLLATCELFATPTFEGNVAPRIAVVGLILAALWHLGFLRVPPGIDDDVHRYVWDGRLQKLGYNPYFVIPSDPAVKGLHTPETRNLNNPDLPSPYPPGAQLFFRAVTTIQESVFAFKVAFVICDSAIVFLLLDILRRTGRGVHLVLPYAWNPLLAIEVAGSGHIDILGALLLVVSVAALARNWRAIAAVTFGLAISVKFLPIVLLPLYWKRVRIRDAALTVLVVGTLYLPFLNRGRIPIGSFGTYVQSFRFNGPLFAALDRVAPPPFLAGLAVLVGLVTAALLRRASVTRASRRGDTPDRSAEPFAAGLFASETLAWPMAASLLCAPVVFPWYLLWLLPFLLSAPTLPIVVWTVSIIPVYMMWHLRTLGHPWGSLPVWVMILEYGCVTLSAAVIAMRRVMRPSCADTRTRI